MIPAHLLTKALLSPMNVEITGRGEPGPTADDGETCHLLVKPGT